MKPNTDAEKAITGSFLQKILRYDSHTGDFFMAKTRGGGLIGSKTGYRRRDGYVQIKIHGRWFLAHRLAWVWMYGQWPPKEIDHIDRDKSNNRIDNLRLATRPQNCANANIKRNNKSGIPGVFYLVRKDGRSPRWIAYITANRKQKRLGIFKTKKDAIAARLAAEQLYHGEFARST